jgi:transposase
LNQEVERCVVPFDQADEIERLDTIPGVGPLVAQGILAELGIDMTRFPTAAHAVSWAGLAPGKNESAGRNRSAKTTKGNRHLKALLVQAAHTVARSKDNYLGAQFRRLAARRGTRRAAVAVARSILVRLYRRILLTISCAMAPSILSLEPTISTSVTKNRLNVASSNAYNNWVTRSL